MRRPWLLPLVPLYAAGVAWRARGFVRHPERAKRLNDPVISIGSLSAGGAGKTPFVIALAEALRRSGHGIDVLTRGHGRVSTGNLRVRADGDAAEFGDEPLLLARRLGCPVYVARERLLAGRMAETDRRVLRDDRRLALHLLDDGLQHRQLARAVDIVLFTAEDARDTLLPAGNLREPLRALQRADVVVLREDEAEELQPVVERLAAQARPRVWIIQRRYAVVEGAATRRPLAFCGIARPASFRASLVNLGIAPAGFVALRDHQRYDDAAVAKLIKRAAGCGADGFVTTAKDAVKLTPAVLRSLEKVGPVAVTDVMVQLLHEQRCAADVLSMIEAKWNRR